MDYTSIIDTRANEAFEKRVRQLVIKAKPNAREIDIQLTIQYQRSTANGQRWLEAKKASISATLATLTVVSQIAEDSR